MPTKAATTLHHNPFQPVDLAGNEFPGKYRLWCHCPALLESHLQEYFSQFGNCVSDVYIPRDRHNGARKSYGFVTLETEDALRRIFGSLRLPLIQPRKGERRTGPVAQSKLAAGSEHIINGRTVRINLAGPRPDQQQQQQAVLQQPQGSLQAGFPGMMPWQPLQPALTALPTASAFAEQTAEGGESGAEKGRGPRIYVGGIPTAVSETMVRNHFSQWGTVLDVYFPKDRALNRRKNFCFVTFATQQAAEKAAAQSNREISGYRIESISITHERQEHYVRKQSGLPTGLASAGLPQEAGPDYVEDPSGQWGAAGSASSFAPEAFPAYGSGLGGLVRYPQMGAALQPGTFGAGGGWPLMGPRGNEALLAGLAMRGFAPAEGMGPAAASGGGYRVSMAGQGQALQQQGGVPLDPAALAAGAYGWQALQMGQAAGMQQAAEQAGPGAAAAPGQGPDLQRYGSAGGGSYRPEAQAPPRP